MDFAASASKVMQSAIVASVMLISEAKLVLHGAPPRSGGGEALGGRRPPQPVSMPAAPGRHRPVLLQQGRGGPQDAGWFGDFDQMESSYTEDGVDADLAENPGRNVQFGSDPGFTPGASGRGLLLRSSSWFDESASAGKAEAWQTHYPAASTGIAGRGGGQNNIWRDTPEGWVQNYNPSDLLAPKSSGIGRQPADWFDSSVLNYDGFGRPNLPYPDSPKRLLDVEAVPWRAQAVNTTVACPTIGCTASVALQAFDPVEQEATNCKLTIGVHATDYDNEWGREAIDFWKVNGLLARAVCDPRARGCNASASRPLYSCLEGLPVDHLMDGNGTLIVEGRISKMVDECPYEGNLLSGVAVVSCMVRSRAALAAAQQAVERAAQAADAVSAQAAAREASKEGAAGAAAGTYGAAGEGAGTYGAGAGSLGAAGFPGEDAAAQNESFSISATLHCSAPGCSAHRVLNVDPTLAMLGGRCFMSVTANQTDFDDGLGAPEEFEFVNVSGLGSVVNHTSPGKNPCNIRYRGEVVSEDDLKFNLLEEYDVTEELLATPAGSLRVAAKISDNVDECASEGNLLAALVEVRCDPPSGA